MKPNRPYHWSRVW